MESGIICIDNDRRGVNITRAILRVPRSSARANRWYAIGAVACSDDAVRILIRASTLSPQSGGLAITATTDVATRTGVREAIAASRFAFA
jgi:hypothetical protein